MKKMILWSLVCLLGAAAPQGLAAQKKSPEAKQEQRQEQKQAEQEQNQLLFEQAAKALENRNFVLEATRVQYGNGKTDNVVANNNFVLMSDDQGMMQLNYSAARNTLTIAGTVLGLKSKTNKKGDVTVSYDIEGKGMSAAIVITLAHGSNFATAMVTSTYNGTRVNFLGTLLPGEQSSVFKNHPMEKVPRGLR